MELGDGRVYNIDLIPYDIIINILVQSWRCVD